MFVDEDDHYVVTGAKWFGRIYSLHMKHPRGCEWRSRTVGGLRGHKQPNTLCQVSLPSLPVSVSHEINAYFQGKEIHAVDC